MIGLTSRVGPSDYALCRYIANAHPVIAAHFGTDARALRDQQEDPNALGPLIMVRALHAIKRAGLWPLMTRMAHAAVKDAVAAADLARLLGDARTGQLPYRGIKLSVVRAERARLAKSMGTAPDDPAVTALINARVG